MDTGLSGDSMEKLKGVRIAPLDDDDDDFEGQENEEVQEPTFEEEEEDDDDEEEEEPVTLGFVEKPKHSWSLLRQLFPSKAGGVPAWLDPVNLPSGRSCACDTCGNPLQFLLQAMHRKINCQQLSLSSQLHNSSSSGGETTSMEIIKATSNALWPEYEILNEDESELDAEMSDDNAYDKLLISQKRTDDSMMSLVDCFKGDSDRKCWASFQERIAKAPEQVLRYCRNANARPLWPMSSGRPSKDDIPHCSYCGSPSDFEFQILPQLLYYFGVKNDDVDSLDWATIAVYTCRASCEASIAYKQEFAWVQL
uniref:Programmed cell death protein 2 C-terminal domain-containing protein n=1 Tax=Manihot esculenta TaxID=3983 RepID=A0A2C9VUD4_MANES